MRTRYRGVMLLAFILMAAVAVIGVGNPVSAVSCVEQLGYSSLSSQYYYNSNIAVNVPVSATCSYVTTQLYAVGNVYDTSSNRNLGSVSTALTTVTANTFTGQLVFNLSPSIIGHQLQVTVSIYNGQYGYYGNGAPLATAAQLLRVNNSNYQYGYNYQNGYNYGYNYQNSYNYGYNYQYGDCYRRLYCNYRGYNGNYYNGFNNYQNSYNYPNGNYPGYYNGNYYTTCQSTGNSMVQCSGYLYQPGNGCVELAVPIDNGYWFESRVYQYYTLQNLPSSYNSGWHWVTVTGQLNQGYNSAPTGAVCPGNYIIVSTLTP